MPDTQVRATGEWGKPESIHIQRDPMRGKRGYYVKGMTGRTKDGVWPCRKYDPVTDCAKCKGTSFVLNEAVNKRRSHFMQYHSCRSCGGTGKRGQDGG